MTKLEKIHAARTHTTGGREGGTSRTNDGRPPRQGTDA